MLASVPPPPPPPRYATLMLFLYWSPPPPLPPPSPVAPLLLLRLVIDVVAKGRLRGLSSVTRKAYRMVFGVSDTTRERERERERANCTRHSTTDAATAVVVVVVVVVVAPIAAGGCLPPHPPLPTVTLCFCHQRESLLSSTFTQLPHPTPPPTPPFASFAPATIYRSIPFSLLKRSL